MPGPLRKSAAMRRRRNKPKTTTAPATKPKAAKVPGLPPKTPMWRAETRAWWKTIHESQAAALWVPADRFALVRLAILYDLVLRGADAVAVLREVTALEDRLGLNPLARRKLDVGAPPPSHAGADEPTEVDDQGDDERWARAAG